jgi:hypothetical protein
LYQTNRLSAAIATLRKFLAAHEVDKQTAVLANNLVNYITEACLDRPKIDKDSEQEVASLLTRSSLSGIRSSAAPTLILEAPISSCLETRVNSMKGSASSGRPRSFCHRVRPDTVIASCISRMAGGANCAYELPREAARAATGSYPENVATWIVQVNALRSSYPLFCAACVREDTHAVRSNALPANQQVVGRSLRGFAEGGR